MVVVASGTVYETPLDGLGGAAVGRQPGGPVVLWEGSVLFGYLQGYAPDRLVPSGPDGHQEKGGSITDRLGRIPQVNLASGPGLDYEKCTEPGRAACQMSTWCPDQDRTTKTNTEPDRTACHA